jgi:HD domain-containing protein
MLTGQADLTAAVAAVNEGNIFQFLTKRCPSDMLGRALEALMEQHRLITAERALLEETLKGSIAVMTAILARVNPPAFSRAHRIRRYVEHMARELGLPDRWQYELAAMLSQIGCVAVPPGVMESGILHRPWLINLPSNCRLSKTPII